MRCGGLNPFGLGLGTVVGSRERDNEQLGSIKGWEFLDQLREYNHVRSQDGLCYMGI